MQSSSIIVSSPIFHPFSTSRSSSKGRKQKTSLSSAATMASRRSGEGDDYGSGSWMVDKNMIILRKRIEEMKKTEKNYEAPCDWMEWEKQYYKSYDSTVCEAMGVLQTLLMNTRPSLTLAIIGLLAISVPVSIGVLFYHLVQLGDLILKGIHLN